MELTLAIKYIYPILTDEDFSVLDDNQWEWPYIVWLNEKIEQPTQVEMETAWIEVLKIQEKEIIEKEFQETIKTFTEWYSQAEIDTWVTKVDEAKNVLNWEVSDLLNALLIEWENIEDFSVNILQKAAEYSNIYLTAEKLKREKIKALSI